ncbi:MAG: hypothetical protein AAGE52_11255 [Myxococcota bacterium]
MRLLISLAFLLPPTFARGDVVAPGPALRAPAPWLSVARTERAFARWFRALAPCGDAELVVDVRSRGGVRMVQLLAGDKRCVARTLPETLPRPGTPRRVRVEQRDGDANVFPEIRPALRSEIRYVHAAVAECGGGSIHFVARGRTLDLIDAGGDASRAQCILHRFSRFRVPGLVEQPVRYQVQDE